MISRVIFPWTIWLVVEIHLCPLIGQLPLSSKKGAGLRSGRERCKSEGAKLGILDIMCHPILLKSTLRIYKRLSQARQMYFFLVFVVWTYFHVHVFVCSLLSQPPPPPPPPPANTSSMNLKSKLLKDFNFLSWQWLLARNLRIEVTFFVCIGKWKDKDRVYILELVKRELALFKLHATRVLSFPNVNKTSVLQSIHKVLECTICILF